MSVRQRMHDGNTEQWCSRHNGKQGAWLPVDQFHKGDMPYCKACRSSYHKESYDPGKVRARNFRYYYKHDESIYDRLFELQNGLCAICGRPPEAQPTGRYRTMRAILATDHNHQTGKVRGLLCHHCNQVLGWARENPDHVRDMIKYLENDGIA
jgi:Recombination endonuclease VII